MNASGLPVSGGAGAGPCRAATAAALDPLETTSQTPGFIDDSEHLPLCENPDAMPWEHRGWAPIRRRVMRAMIDLDLPAGRRHDFWRCCDRVYVYRNITDGEIARQLDARMKGQEMFFMTLTVRGKPHDSLRSLIDRLNEAWKALRRIKQFTHDVRGGAVMMEIKWSKTSGGHWHPHYHIVYEGNWCDPKWLSAAWKAVTGDSDQVDVQRIKESGKVLSYVTKYASKPMDSSFTMRHDLLKEAMTTLSGRRLCACFGTWYGTPLREEVDDEAEEEILPPWVYCGTEDDLRRGRSVCGADPIELLRAVERVRALRQSLIDRCRSGSPPGQAA